MVRRGGWCNVNYWAQGRKDDDEEHLAQRLIGTCELRSLISVQSRVPLQLGSDGVEERHVVLAFSGEMGLLHIRAM